MTRPTLRGAVRRAHLSVALIAVTMAALSLTAVGLLTVRASARDNLDLIARSLTYTAEAAVVFGDRAAASEALQVVASREDLGEAAIFGRDGHLLARWKRPDKGGLQSMLKPLGAMALPPPLGLPIVRANVEIGRVEVRGDGGALVRFLIGGLGALLACLALSAMLALHLSRRMLRGITVPLGALARVAHEVRSDRALDRRVPSAEIVELDDLGNDFNALLDELAQRQDRLRQQNESLAHQASHDSLTGLPNRAYFEQRLAQAVESAEQAGAHIAVLFLDSDHFKEINDRHGHAAGDVLLAAVAARVRAQVRESDVVARLGGDEFGVLLAPLRATEDALRVADKVIAAMLAPVRLPDGSSAVPSLSIGVAVFPDHGSDANELLRGADEAMYKAKESRRGSRQLAAFSPHRPQGQENSIESTS